MSKGIKILGITLGIIVLLGVMVWGGVTWFMRRDLPKTNGTVKLAGLKQPVEILRDTNGVAHIYAHTTEDLFFGEGYTHAQERFWQMEFERRVASGRLSEIFGETTLDTDRYLRQFNFKGLTEQSYAMLDPEGKRVVDSYTAGVNAYIKDHSPAQLGLEFALLGLQGNKVKIEEWTPVDSMIWAEIMIYDQSDQMETELTNMAQLAAVGQSMYADLHPAYRSDRPTIIQAEDVPGLLKSTGTVGGGFSPDELDILLSLADQFKLVHRAPSMLADLGFGQAGASNSFVVSGAKTDTGKPLLANDPHMAVNMPSLWYEVGLHCVEKSPDCIYNLRGFSLPGVPGILIGHNDRIAWGLTNASFDAEDVFIEKVNPANPNQYEVNGQWMDMELRREEIKVHGQDEPVVIYVRSTRNGVVGSDVLTDQKPFSYGDSGPQPYVLSYAWTALQPIRTVQAVLGVNRAQNWDDFVNALQYFDAGKQNLLYADVDGNIGYIMPGKVPIRAKGDGTLPVPGWNDNYRWTGFIPYDKLPKVFNPKQGFIVTANNPQLREEQLPYLLSKVYYMGQRAARITQMIQNDANKVNIKYMESIQTDNQSLPALEFIPYLKGLSFDNPQVSAARDSLLTWDGEMLMDSPQAALYAIFWKNLMAEIFDDQLPAKLKLGAGNWTEDTVYHLMQNPDNNWWDDLKTPDIKERRDAILKTAFEKAFKEGVAQFGNNLSNWRWGTLHTILFQNATLGKSGISLIENIFNRGPFPVNGSESVVQKTCWSAEQPYQATCIPALRQVIDLGNLSNSQMIHSVGQSGHPKSPHYDDFIDPWRNFQYLPSNWLRSEVEAGEYDMLTLQPK